jgi:iron complex outermembrane recepter protein
MKHTPLVLPLLLSLLFAAALPAQRTVVGKVTDADKEPLIGATVLVKGAVVGTKTDTDGNYKVEVPAGYGTLVFRYTGFEDLEKTLDAVNVLNVTLQQDGVMQEVVISVSRNATRTKIETPLAVDLIPVQNLIREVGQVDLNQILTYAAPSFQSSRQAIADGTDHLDPAQLRGLGPDQVLVLINGKRRHQSALVNVNGTVNRGTVGTDLNAIPASSIERVEILRDGAAAIYGSDAIAGVINIVTKGNTGILDVNATSGIHFTSYDKNYVFNKLNNISGDQAVRVQDGLNYQIGANYGLGFGENGEKGFLNLTGEYSFRDRTNRSGLYTGQIYPAVGGQVRDDSILGAKGLTRDFFDMRIGNSRVSSGGLFVNSEYLLADGWTLYLFGGFNKKNGNAAGFYRYPNAIPASSQARPIYPDGFLPDINSDVTDLSASVGIRGKLGSWDADLSQTIGQNRFDFEVDNSVNYTQSSVDGSGAQRTFDCGGLRFRQLTTNLGFTRKFEDVMEGFHLALGAEFRVDGFEQRAGETASWQNYNPPLAITPGAQVFAGFRPEFAANDSRTNAAAYADAELDLTEKFLLGAALRFENYSDFGSTLNYKLVSRYKISPRISLRGSLGSGFRAPSQQQKNYGRTSTVFLNTGSGLQPFETGTYPNGSRLAEAFGIPDLKEETSRNYALGITARPSEGLELTLDAYQIDIDNRIVLTNNFSAGGNADLAAQLAAVGASTVNFFANAVNTRSQGIEAVISYGKHFERKQELRLTFSGTLIHNEVEKGSNGKAKIMASDIIVSTGQIGSYFNREDQSRIEVANPRQKANLIIHYKAGKFGAMLRNAYWGKVTYLDPLNINDQTTWSSSTTLASFNNALNGNQPETLDQTFEGKVITDLTLNYQIAKHLNFALGANNLFDIYQDRHQHSVNFSAGRFVYSRRVQQFGFNGRFMFARLRFNMDTQKQQKEPRFFL